MKNFRKRFEIQHGRLSPDRWKVKPSRESIENNIEQIRQRTQRLEQEDVPSGVDLIDSNDCLFEGYTSAAFLHLFEQERVYRLGSDFLSHQSELKPETRAL